jgi:hypothetical protein
MEKMQVGGSKSKTDSRQKQGSIVTKHKIIKSKKGGVRDNVTQAVRACLINK